MATKLPFANLRFQVAVGEDLERALELRRSIYHDEFGVAGVDDFDLSATHLIATTKSGWIASGLRIIPPNMRPLEIEDYLDLERVLGPDRRPAQIGGFFVVKEFRNVSQWGLVPLGMLKFACAIASQADATDLIMRTHVAGIRQLYQSAMFEVLEDCAFAHPLWGPVYVMRLDLAALYREDGPPVSPIAKFLTAALLPNMLLP